DFDKLFACRQLGNIHSDVPRLILREQLAAESLPGSSSKLDVSKVLPVVIAHHGLPKNRMKSPQLIRADTTDDARLKADAKEQEFNDEIERLKAALSRM